MEDTQGETKKQSKHKAQLSISFDFRIICALLLIAIAVMLIIWKPWSQSKVSDRTINVTGEATLQAKPGEYVFTPSYDFTNADKQTALNALTAQSAAVTAKLKALGVTDSQIKTDSNSGGLYYDYVINDDNSTTYTLMFTVTVDSQILAQKVQDYLTTTSPSGSVSPDVTFSTSQQKTLDAQARDAATKDAHAKAEQSAKNLGFKLGAVKSVTDGNGFSNVEPLNSLAAGSTLDTSSSAKPSLAVQPGQNSFDYSVSVVYYIK